MVLKGISIIINTFLFINFYLFGATSIIIYLLTLKNEIFNSELKRGQTFTLDKVITIPMSSNYFFYSFFKTFDLLDLVGIVVYFLLALTSFINDVNLNSLVFLIFLIAIYFFSILKFRLFFYVLNWIFFSIVSLFSFKIINSIDWTAKNTIDYIYAVSVNDMKALYTANEQYLGSIMISYLFLSFFAYLLSRHKIRKVSIHTQSKSQSIDFIGVENYKREHNIFPMSLGLLIGMLPVYLSNIPMIINLSPAISSLAICIQTKLFIQEFSPFFFSFVHRRKKGCLIKSLKVY